MMKRKLFLVMAIAAIVFAGCKKENDVNYLEATISNFQNTKDGKVYIDNSHYACWHYTSDYQDQVVLNSTTASVVANSSKYYIEVDASEVNASMYYSIFPASAVTLASNATAPSITPATSGATTVSVTLPEVQVYKEVDGKQKVDALMAAMGAHRLNFLNICGLLKVNITNLPTGAWLTKIEVTTSTEAPLCGTGIVTFNSENNIVMSTLSGAINDGKTIKLQFDNDDNNNGSYYIVVPPVSNTAFEFKVHYRLADNASGTRLYSKTLTQTVAEGETGYSIASNTLAEITLNLANAPQVEHLPGAFSIDNNGTQIYFSRGNLLYDENLTNNSGWNNGWGFEQNQYTATPCSQGNGNNGAVHHTGYMPMHFKSGWTTPALHNDGAHNNNLTDIPALAFGANSNWRLLSSTEWQYLINHANPTFVTVAGKDGIMLFPDLFEWPVYNGVQMSQASSYDANAWQQLEDAGCIFLIAAGTGDKMSGSIENPGSGYYWSSTPNPDNSTGVLCLKFKISDETIVVTDGQADWGMCVRLVYVPTPTTNTTEE